MKSGLRKFTMTLSLLVLGGATMFVAGCSGGSGTDNAVPAQAQNPGATPTTFVQVERLGQPAINEGLISTNANLNLWNSLSPNVEAQFLAGSGGSQFGPIATEAVNLLTALGNDQARINGIVTNMLPDVMRIDTTQPSGYAGNVTSIEPLDAKPSRGRLLTDDVVDVTLAVVLPPALAPLRTDNVSYSGCNAGGTRHTAPAAAFPYLAPPTSSLNLCP